jgi:hypothetical protein
MRFTSKSKVQRTILMYMSMKVERKIFFIEMLRRGNVENEFECCRDRRADDHMVTMECRNEREEENDSRQ